MPAKRRHVDATRMQDCDRLLRVQYLTVYV